jgi:prophage regulatory protein
MDRTGKSRSSLYETMDKRSPRFDPRFPRPFKCGGRRTYFLEAEVEAWILEKAAIARAA